MQPIASLVPQNRSELKRMGDNCNALDQSAAESQIGQQFNDIFNQICTLCPGWRAALPAEDAIQSAKKVWFKVLVLQGHKLGKLELARGLRWLQERRSQYLPSPQEFLDSCLADSSYPTRKVAFDIFAAGLGKSQHPLKAHRMIAWMRTKMSGAFHPTTSADERDRTFNTGYDAALELERNGELAVWESEQERLKNTPRLDSKPVDANLDMYRRLLKISPEIAAEFVLECRAKGIILDVDAGTVTRADANLKAQTAGGAA